MIPFHVRCPDVAKAEIRSAAVLPGGAPGGLPADEYAFLEYYCDDPKCDCRRVFIEVLAKSRSGAVMASINFGWEPEAFYRKSLPFMPEAAREIVSGSLDPMNRQSKLAPELLKLFQGIVADEAYKVRLKRHYELFRRSAG